VPSKDQWALARSKYEGREITQESLAQSLGCSRQAVAKRIKREGWLRYVPMQPLEELPQLPQVAGPHAGLRSDENIATIIDTYALTGNKSMACRQVGIDDKTLTKWCIREPELSVAMQQARESHLIGQYRKIASAKDWKAAKEILARSPETKDQWGEVHEKGPQIILNIHRDEVIIDQG